ncbi:MAG TPA: hypothetical protein P5091_01915, partial [Acholeplasmataceae bacterium]|nr:hypothetical protein [Acholeplasmataceae bacterium]
MLLKLSKKHLIILLIVFNMLFSFGMSFAYWASSVEGNTSSNDSTIGLGVWYDGTPIYTAEEFIDVVTTTQNTGTYVIAKDIDFQNTSYPSWINNDEIVFSGSLDGNNKVLSNISATNLRGIFGVLDGATIKNLT